MRALEQERGISYMLPLLFAYINSEYTFVTTTFVVCYERMGSIIREDYLSGLRLDTTQQDFAIDLYPSLSSYWHL